MFIDCKIDRCFLGKTTPFTDCYFSDLTKITDIQWHSFHFKNYPMAPNARAGLFASFQSAYAASGADELATEYYWKARKALTKYSQ